ncbi:MFS transporter [Lachnoclostridium sp. Marseille-P6806]|uniref:MFS transporter n=1 Tax=Lachnoclostridium sp. Marseille-P6806 TaxID=2364793 RepID=UPI0010302DE7|nr:MFS transporter [Lachnoclostridium sp. Marseille-P6806]
MQKTGNRQKTGNGQKTGNRISAAVKAAFGGNASGTQGEGASGQAERQLGKLYLITAASGFQIAGASWVALLAARGFSLAEIGVMEAVFHLVSLCGEIPSGVAADVLGRKQAMLFSQLITAATSVMMLLSGSFFTAALAVGLSALSYNFASGTREALAYDGLKSEGKEDAYDRFASGEMMLYRISSASATLCAGFALFLGYRVAYGIDALIGLVGFAAALGLKDISAETAAADGEKGTSQKETRRPRVFGNGCAAELCRRFRDCAAESVRFLIGDRYACAVILINAVLGAFPTLLLFFLQARLPEEGLPEALLGPALFFMGMGHVLGARMMRRFRSVRYRRILTCSAAGITAALASLFLHNPWVLCAGGFLAAFADDFLQVRTDVTLNDRIPSAQRATLISVNSFAFSAVMIVLSPIMGAVI